jgi:Flp pilus assembly protein TadB
MTLVEVAVQVISGLLALLVGAALPIGIVVGLLWLSKRHLEGRRSRFDRALGGAARAGLIESHLEAGTPHPDDIAVPKPARPLDRQ